MTPITDQKWLVHVFTQLAVDMTVMDEIGLLIRSKPGPDAPPHQLAHWYELKAHMLEQVAQQGQANPHTTLRQAGAAHRRAADLLAKCA